MRSVCPALLHEAAPLAPHLPAAEQCAILQPFRQSTCDHISTYIMIHENEMAN